MSSTDQGRKAEKIVADYLVDVEEHTLLSLNWRTRYCEIDLITIRDGTIYFTEVKFRNSPNQGSGLEYITPKKLQQMKFAAEIWLNDSENTDYADMDCVLLGAEVDSTGKILIVPID